MEDVIVDIKEVGWDDMEWINLAYCRDSWWDVMDMVMNFQSNNLWGIPSVSSNLFTAFMFTKQINYQPASKWM